MYFEVKLSKRVKPRIEWREVRDRKNPYRKHRVRSLTVSLFNYPRELEKLIRDDRVRIRARIVLELDIDDEVNWEKIFDPQIFEIEKGEYLGYISYLWADEDRYELWRVKVTDNDIIFELVDRGLTNVLDEWIQKYGDIPRIWNLPPLQTISQAEHYFHETLREYSACPRCGTEVIALCDSSTYVDDFTLINAPRTGCSREQREIYYFICPKCGLKVRHELYTWDAGSVINYDTIIEFEGQRFEASKTGITDDRSLLHYLIDLGKALLRLGIVKIKS